MRRVDLVLHRVYGAHSTRLWIEALVDARFGPVDTGPAPIDEITIDDVLKPTAFCADADNPTADNPAPCSLVVGEPRRISPAELCDNPYRPGEMPLQPFLMRVLRTQMHSQRLKFCMMNMLLMVRFGWSRSVATYVGFQPHLVVWVAAWVVRKKPHLEK